MTTINIFEQATRAKLRFITDRGHLSVEQLWDLPLQSKTNFSLDAIAIAVNRELKNAGEESFVLAPVNKLRDDLQLQLDILKHIIAVKQAEHAAQAGAAARKVERARLTEILAKKQDEELEKLTPEEIKARIAALSDGAPVTV